MMAFLKKRNEKVILKWTVLYRDGVMRDLVTGRHASPPLRV
jgi:hypothetical protein